MHQVMINHRRLKVHKTTGSEGPSHDPYHYVEYDVDTPVGNVVLHEGLGTWIAFNGTKLKTPHGESYVRGHMFPALTGYTVEQLERIHRKLTSRCPKCQLKIFEEVEGYPGETFTVCSSCGEIVDSYFCESAVI